MPIDIDLRDIFEMEIESYFEEENYVKVISEFEENENLLSTSENIVHHYLWSLFKNEGTEKKALHQVEKYEVILDTKRWVLLKGHIAKYIGKTNLDIGLMKEAIAFYKIAGDKVSAGEVAADIRNVQQKIKDKKNDKKESAKERELAEQNTLHRFKTSRSITFCQYCGKDSSWHDVNCKREYGHSYVAMKVEDSWQTMCSKCGHDSSYNDITCGH
ncbi:MAG: hypothetical protein H8E12_09760 [Rhodobacteraceae bacterium]|nr:hypothetical protein [Paracoccaceae bacterium]